MRLNERWPSCVVKFALQLLGRECEAQWTIPMTQLSRPSCKTLRPSERARMFMPFRLSKWQKATCHPSLWPLPAVEQLPWQPTRSASWRLMVMPGPKLAMLMTLTGSGRRCRSIASRRSLLMQRFDRSRRLPGRRFVGQSQSPFLRLVFAAPSLEWLEYLTHSQHPWLPRHRTPCHDTHTIERTSLLDAHRLMTSFTCVHREPWKRLRRNCRLRGPAAPNCQRSEELPSCTRKGWLKCASAEARRHQQTVRPACCTRALGALLQQSLLWWTLCSNRVCLPVGLAPCQSSPLLRVLRIVLHSSPVHRGVPRIGGMLPSRERGLMLGGGWIHGFLVMQMLDTVRVPTL